MSFDSLMSDTNSIRKLGSIAYAARGGAFCSVARLRMLAAGFFVFVVLCGASHAQRRGVIVQEALIQGVELRDLAAGNVQPANTKPMLLKQMRGLIQNELSIVGDICDLAPKQQQSLADLAESEWKAMTNAPIVKRTQENVYGMIDLDGLSERLVRNWLESISSAEQLGKYDEELADRMKWRQKAVVSKLLDTLESKLNLSGVQMGQIEERLNEKWKDRFYRSLEATFDNSALLPEIRPTWISEFLSESQRAALVTRDAQQQRFGVHQGWQDSPSQAMNERFKVGNAVGSEQDVTDTNEKKPSPIDAIIEKARAGDEGAVDAKKP